MVVIITAGAYVLASLGSEARIPANIIPFLVIVLGLLLGAHVALRRLAPEADPILLPDGRAAERHRLRGHRRSARSRPNCPSGEMLARQQSVWTAIGVAAFVATLWLVKRPRDLMRYRYTFGFVGIGLLLLPLVPGLGTDRGSGSRIWVAFGPVNFQPGEVAKVLLAIFFAAYLAEQRELIATSVWKVGPFRLPDPKHLGPVLIAWAVTAGRDGVPEGPGLLAAVLRPVRGDDLGGHRADVVPRHRWGAVRRRRRGSPGGRSGTCRSGSTIWLDPWKDPSGTGYQLLQGMFAMAFGGVTGTGLGLGSDVPIPASESDFIFAVISEQLGLLGGALVIMAFLLMVGSGLRIASRADHAFDKLLATGLTLLLGLQAFIIIAGVTRLLPLTGVTLPFVSYGGSSLVVNYVLLALLLRVSDQNERARSAGRPGAAVAA